MNLSHNILSPTQSEVVNTVLRFSQISSTQLRRLHYLGTPSGCKTRCGDHLKKLTERGEIRRMPHRLNGYGKGSGEFVYTPPNSTARNISLHTLDVTEIYVRLREAGTEVVYDPEPWAPTYYKGQKVTPDAHVKLPGIAQYFIEVDESSESPSVISAKMSNYVRAARSLDGGPFPIVLWVAHDANRVRMMADKARSKHEPGLFECALFDDAIGVLEHGHL
jgi:hypothetical protein